MSQIHIDTMTNLVQTAGINIYSIENKNRLLGLIADYYVYDSIMKARLNAAVNEGLPSKLYNIKKSAQSDELIQIKQIANEYINTLGIIEIIAYEVINCFAIAIGLPEIDAEQERKIYDDYNKLIPQIRNTPGVSTPESSGEYYSITVRRKYNILFATAIKFTVDIDNGEYHFFQINGGEKTIDLRQGEHYLQIGYIYGNIIVYKIFARIFVSANDIIEYKIKTGKNIWLYSGKTIIKANFLSLLNKDSTNIKKLSIIRKFRYNYDYRTMTLMFDDNPVKLDIENNGVREAQLDIGIHTVQINIGKATKTVKLDIDRNCDIEIDIKASIFGTKIFVSGNGVKIDQGE